LMWSETSEMHLASDDVSVCRTTFAARWWNRMQIRWDSTHYVAYTTDR
jgi:hypothetical protein